MKTRIVRIGNSRGIRIPKLLLEEAGLEGEVELNAANGSLVIRSLTKPRAGWTAAFRDMAREGDDALLDDVPSALSAWDEDEWDALSRFEVYLVNLDPTVGTEIRKTRPCLVVSPNEMNRAIRTVIVAPMTTKGRRYPTRVSCRFKGKDGQVVLDQLRTVDRARLVKKLGRLDRNTAAQVLQILQEMFAP